MNSLTGVIATALCALNKRNLQMEAAAAGNRAGFWCSYLNCFSGANKVYLMIIRRHVCLFIHRKLEYGY